MGTFNTIPHFKFWCQKVLPLVYDDSLSYYELLCKVVNYLNHIIDDVNKIPEYIKEMIDSEHLEEYIDEIFGEIRVQIARVDEGTNETASANRDKDELVWLDGKLARITRDILAGDRYVEETGEVGVTGNFVYTSVEVEINRVKSEIETIIGDMSDLTTEEKTTIVGAINEVLETLNDETLELGNKIGDLTLLETEVKSNIVSAINELVDDLTTEIEDREDYIVFNPTDLTSDLNNIGLKEKAYSVSSDMTINAQLVIPKGATINIDNGVTLTINGSILAERYAIFTGSGNVVINGDANSVIYPEWFGAKVDDNTVDNGAIINKAINSITAGIIDFAPNVYWIETPIVVDKVLTLRGVHDKTYLTAGNSDCSPVLTISGSGTTYVDGASVIDMVIGRYSSLNNSTGLYLTRVANTTLRGLRFANFNFCVKYKFTTSTYNYDIICLTALEQSQFFGFILDCTESTPLAGTSANGSCYFRNCGVNVIVQPTGTCEGFYAVGSDIRDLFFESCATANTLNGINLDGTDTILATDINITNCVLDGCGGCGIRISKVKGLDAGVKISNTFISMNPLSASKTQAIALVNSSNVIVNNCELYCYLSEVTAIIIDNCDGCIINNVVCNHAAYGVFITETSARNLLSNIKITRTESAATQGAIAIQGNYNMLQNILLNGNYTMGVYVNGNSNTIIGLIANVSGTKYEDNGETNTVVYVI